MVGWYGGSYGQRVAVDFMCLFAIFIAYVLNWLEEWKQQDGKNGKYRVISCIVYGYCAVCIAWNWLCMIAYWYRILPSDMADWETMKNIVNMICPLS